MKTNNSKLRVIAGVAVGVLLLTASADAANTQIKAAKKFLRKVPAAELPAKADAFIAQAKVEDRHQAYEAVKLLYPNLPISKSAAVVQGAGPTTSGPFVPGPTDDLNRNDTSLVPPGQGRVYSRP